MRVVNRFRKEPVDLQPYGNTISVETASDNPFEDTRDVEVHTQVSGGMAGPDSAHRSKKIHTTAAQVMPLKNGKVPAMRLNAAANKGFNASFMPGMGSLADDVMGPPAPSTLSTIASTLTDIVKQVPAVAQQKYASQTAASNAKAAAAQAKAEQAKSALALAQQNMSAHKGISIPLIAVGVIAAGTALVLFMRSPSRSRRGRR